jgi:parallel beta-helix repeat protein
MFKRSILKLNSSILIITLVISLNILTTTTASTTTKTATVTTKTTPVVTTNTTPVATTNTTPVATTNTTPVATTNTTTVATTNTTSVAASANTTSAAITKKTYVSTTIRAKAQTSRTINIQDFGAHSIDEKGYANFDSSQAINKAIQFAKTNGSTSIDFGSGRFYARDIALESNITYYSTKGAELIASADIQVWHSVLSASNKSNITIKGLTVNGNKQVVFGNGLTGSYNVSFTTCNNVTVENCYIYNSKNSGILLQNNCNYVTIKNNTIYDTDCGILTSHDASNNIIINGNTIYGSKENQYSEPISIYNSNTKGLAHDITITNNIVHDKLNGSGILVMNATKVLIKGNTAYNCFTGINIGIDATMVNDKVTASTDITITENNIYNCTTGITSELSKSVISKNKISDLKGIGIWLVTRNVKSPINNNVIINNTITNINSLGGQEPAIRLGNTADCLIDNNIVLDTRSKVLHWFIIQVTGPNCTNNTVQNNTSLGSTTKDGYQIFVQNAKNTTMQNNKANILNLGTGSKLINNTIN